MKELDELLRHMRGLMRLALVLGGVLVFAVLMRSGHLNFSQGIEGETPVVAELEPDTSLYGSIDEQSGLVIDRDFELVKAQCGACHSTALVVQNRFSRDGWEELIRWMQAEQKLWDLGEQEPKILDYLAKNYAPKAMGRRKNLVNIEWYKLHE